LLLGSALAGLLGVAFDQLTVTISPEYFTVGKGLAEEALRTQVVWLGFRSALPLGALVAGLGLLRATALDDFSWRRWLMRIVSGVFVAFAILPLTMLLADPFGIRLSSTGVMSEAACSRYLIVWGMHTAAYAGLAGGIGFALWSTRPVVATATEE
jgi:hypothetical protein